MPDLPTFDEAAEALSAVGRRFYARGWVLGTSGNFSAVVQRDPLRLAMTVSGRHKGTLGREDFVQIDDRAAAEWGVPAASAEALLHVVVARLRGAGAVLHTHSVWSTILSGRYAQDGGLAVDGYEMLKGLSGVATHAHREWIPILENDQDMVRLARALGDVLDREPAAHAVLLARHGLYTWGATLADAERHVEILEFLFETLAWGQTGV